MRVEDFIGEITTQLTNQSERVSAVCRGLTPEQLNWTPAPSERWSGAQVIKHLMISHRPYILSVREAVRCADTLSPDAPVRHTWFGRTLIDRVSPGKSTPVPPMFLPGSGPFGLEVVEHFLNQQDEWLEILLRSRERDIVHAKIRHPVAGLFRMNLADVFQAVERHNEHHVRQLESLIRDPRFPAATEASADQPSNVS